MSERNENRREGSLARYSAARSRCSPGTTTVVAPEIDYFGDRLGVPLPQFMHHWILVSKL